jgi:polysaccharide biosynthesis transport protein
MNEDSQGATGDELARQTAGAGAGQSPSRSAWRRRPPAGGRSRRPYAVARWHSPTPARRGARGLFVAHWAWMLLVTTLVVAAAAMLSWSRTPTYRASADVLVQPRLFAAGTAPQVPDMGSEKAAAASTVVLDIAARGLRVATGQLSHGVSVSVPLNTHVLHISYSSTDAEQARQRAQAVATAYVSYWLAQQPPLGRTSTRPTTAEILDTAVITPATRPSAPASPNHLVDVGIALIIGLVLAGGTAYLRDRLDNRLRGPDELQANGGGPVLAAVSVARRTRVDPVVARKPTSPGAEAYRELRTLLLRVAEQRGAKSLLVTSPTGDAQTVVSANIAVSLAQAGQRVVLVQADMRRPHGHELFDIDQVPGLADVLEDRVSLGSALVQPEVAGPRILPAGLLVGDIGTALHPSRLGEVIQQLSTEADFVVIDAPAALAGSDIATMLKVVDLVLMVGDSRRTTRAQVRAAASQLEHVHDKLIGCTFVTFGRRARFVAAPLSLVAGQAGHASTRPASGDEDDEGEGDSATWLLRRLGDSPDPTSSQLEKANGWDSPAKTGKR